MIRSGFRYRQWCIAVVATALCGTAMPAASQSACAPPAQPVSVDVAVFHEYAEYTDVLGGKTPIAALVQSHLAIAKAAIGGGGLQLNFVLAQGAPQQLSSADSARVKELVDSATGADFESELVQFKSSSSAVFDDTRINVYYVDLADVSGVHFRAREGHSENVIVMGTGFKADTLAHEIGHAFSLRHVNFWTHDDPDAATFPNGIQVEYCAEYGYWNDECDFDSTNLMWAAREGRDHVSDGQTFRIACNEDSALIRNGDFDPSPAQAVDCPDWSTLGDCPEVF